MSVSTPAGRGADMSPSNWSPCLHIFIFFLKPEDPVTESSRKRRFPDLIIDKITSSNLHKEQASDQTSAGKTGSGIRLQRLIRRSTRRGQRRFIFMFSLATLAAVQHFFFKGKREALKRFQDSFGTLTCPEVPSCPLLVPLPRLQGRVLERSHDLFSLGACYLQITAALYRSACPEPPRLRPDKLLQGSGGTFWM